MYGIGITGGCHRLWAHKSFTASTPLKVLLMLWNSGANQGSIFHWSRDHRLHHKYSDTDLDPHDIKKGFFFSHVGWLLKNKSPELVEEGRKIDMSDLKNDPVVMFQKKHYLSLSMTMCFLIPSNSIFNYSNMFLDNRSSPCPCCFLYFNGNLYLDSQCYLVCEFSLSYVWLKTLEQEY